MRESNLTYLMVGNVTNGYADNADVDLTTMPVDSIVLVKTTETTLKSEEGALVAGQEYELVNKLSDGTIIRSPKFTSANLITKGKAAYVQPTEQVSFLGYDGTTINGLGTITLGNSYIVGLWLNHTKGTYDQKGEVKHISAYATDTLQATVVKNLMESHLKNFSSVREKYPSILCDRIARTTSVAALGGSGTVAYLVNGSKTVSAYIKATAANTTLTADDFAVTAADVINIPSYNGRTFTFNCLDAVGHTCHIGTAAVYIADANTAADGSDNATALAAAINLSTNAISAFASAAAVGATVTVTYKEDFRGLPPVVFSNVAANPATVAVTITSGDAVSVKYVAAATAAAATFELDEPWQGPTGYVIDGTTEATNIGITTLNVANAWGLKFTGIAQPFNPQVDTNVKVDFDVLTDSFGAYGDEYKSVKPSKGHGSWKDVAQLEAYAQGNDSWIRHCAYPTPNYRREATVDSGVGYDIITIVGRNEYIPSASGISVNSPYTVTLALRSGLSYDTLDTAFGV